MPPPDLAGDTPVFDIPHPSQIIVRPSFRNDPDTSVFNGLNRRSGQGLDLDEPLRRQIGLDHGFAAIAFSNGHFMVIDFREERAMLSRAARFWVGL